MKSRTNAFLAGLVLCIWLAALIVNSQTPKPLYFNSVAHAVSAIEAAGWYVNLDHTGGVGSSGVVCKKRLTPAEATTAKAKFLLGNGDPDFVYIRTLNIWFGETPSSETCMVWGNLEVNGSPQALKELHDSLVR